MPKHSKKFKSRKTTVKALILSDSICRALPTRSDLAKVISHSGAKTYTLKDRVEAHPEDFQEFSHILLHVGSNDLDSRCPVSDILGNMMHLVSTVCRIAPTARVMVSGILLRGPKYRSRAGLMPEEYERRRVQLNEMLHHELKGNFYRCRRIYLHHLCHDHVHLTDQGKLELWTGFQNLLQRM